MKFLLTGISNNHSDSRKIIAIIGNYNSVFYSYFTDKDYGKGLTDIGIGFDFTEKGNFKDLKCSWGRKVKYIDCWVGFPKDVFIQEASTGGKIVFDLILEVLRKIQNRNIQDFDFDRFENDINTLFNEKKWL